MGLLVEGEWRTDGYQQEKHGGRFKRDASKFRNWVTPDGAPGPSGEGGFAPESGRYHLYVSYACPWAHRSLIFRALKGLEPHVGLSVVSPYMGEDGWTFEEDFPGVVPDSVLGKRWLREVYTQAKPDASGRVTVPVLWDKARGTIVSNESAEIIRMFNDAFGGLTGDAQDFYPEALRGEIDAINDRVYDTVNNGVYKAGFATTQKAYDEAAGPLFDSLDWIEGLLAERRYVAGDRLTEADWRLFTTVVRFDPVYHTHFKCNLRRIEDYPNLLGWTRELFQIPGVAGTVRIDHIKQHYYRSHPGVNPHGLVPLSDGPDLSAPHGRG
jgi:putative glutathione S-transferase